MAGVPCINDSCSITSSVDANGRLDLNVNLVQNGGIECDTGLKIPIFGDPALVAPSTLTECDNLLGVTTDNQVFAKRPGREILPSVPGSERKALTNGSGAAGFDSDYSNSFTIRNDADCSRLFMMRVSHSFIFSVDTPADVAEANGYFEIEINGESGSSAFFIGVPGGLGAGSHQIVQNTEHWLNLSPSASWLIRSRGHRNDDGATGDNLLGSPDPGFGYRAEYKILVADLAATNMFTIT